MMVLRCSNGVTPAAIPGMKLADKPQPVKYLQSAVNSNQTNIRVLLMHLMIYGDRGKMVWTGSDHPYHRPSLRGELITLLPQ
jgi:hypothetical protein